MGMSFWAFVLPFPSFHYEFINKFDVVRLADLLLVKSIIVFCSIQAQKSFSLFLCDSTIPFGKDHTSVNCWLFSQKVDTNLCHVNESHIFTLFFYSYLSIFIIERYKFVRFEFNASHSTSFPQKFEVTFLFYSSVLFSIRVHAVRFCVKLCLIWFRWWYALVIGKRCRQIWMNLSFMEETYIRLRFEWKSQCGKKHVTQLIL